jgi:hypothetical protein
MESVISRESFGWDVHLVEYSPYRCDVLDDERPVRTFRGECAYMDATRYATDLVMSRAYGTPFRGE